MENTVPSILSDIRVNIQSEEIEACHCFGKTDRKTKSKKTIICFVRKHCKVAILNKKKLSSINNNKFNFNAVAKIHINEKLTPLSKSIGFICRKLKRSNIIHACYTREGVVHIKQEKSSKPLKIFHISNLHEFFPDFVFADDKKGDVNTSLLSSYWLITKFIIGNIWLTLVWVTQGYSSNLSSRCGVPWMGFSLKFHAICLFFIWFWRCNSLIEFNNWREF